jgi:hypothetical protein
VANLETFSFADLMALRASLRSAFAEDEPASMEEAAQRIVRLLRDELLDGNGQPACALVRVYKTHAYADLDDELQAFARNIDPNVDSVPAVRCLVLLGTAGDHEAWNSRAASRGHRAIPLTSENAVAGAPMISQLFRQLGLDVMNVLRPEPGFILDVRDTAQNVFYVPQAAGSPYIPAQEDFVIPYGIQSVIGFGGIMASGDFIASILFSKVRVSGEVADLFKVVGLNFKVALLPFTRKPLLQASATR